MADNTSIAKPIKVAILGSTGMLGSMVYKYLSTAANLIVDRHFFDAACPKTGLLESLLLDYDYAINCIGVIKPRIDEASSASVERAVRVNSLFPYLLASAAERANTRVLQIATDCVYFGHPGTGQPYDESAPHDAADVYGKTKSLGEVRSPFVHHLRCSIIGPEGADRPKDSLLEWFLGRPQGATIKGYTNHYWNGITTFHFAKICHGIMSRGVELPSVQHIVPDTQMSKAELLKRIAVCYHRSDIKIEETVAPESIDRTLKTCDVRKNYELWRAAGYGIPATAHMMVSELRAYQHKAVSAQ